MTRQDRGVPTVEKKNVGAITHNAYGKSKVRLTKVTRLPDRHLLQEICVAIRLEGAFEKTYTAGDNEAVVATDSMKNTVYVMAAENSLTDIESFGKMLAKHFLETYKQVSSVSIRLEEELWQRILVDGNPHQHSFYGAGAEKHIAEIKANRSAVDVMSGIVGLKLVKTTDSEFSGFVKDRYTTLPEVTDRIFGTSLESEWWYVGDKHDYQKVYETIRGITLKVFANHYSLSVQHTMHDIGDEVLATVSDVSKIKLTMPNEHRIPFNLKPFGLENKDEVFITTDEPFGLIECTMSRDK